MNLRHARRERLLVPDLPSSSLQNRSCEHHGLGASTAPQKLPNQNDALDHLGTAIKKEKVHRLCINSSRPGREAEARRGGEEPTAIKALLCWRPYSSPNTCARLARQPPPRGAAETPGLAACGALKRRHEQRTVELTPRPLPGPCPSPCCVQRRRAATCTLR